MSKAKLEGEDYIQWLIASPRHVSARQAGKIAPGLIAHDAYTRLLRRLEPSSDALWAEVQPFISRESGWLIIDDSTLDKPYAHHMHLVSRHWSGKHREVVQGINLVSLLWTDGDIAIPVDYRIYHKDSDGLTKNDHMQQMLEKARQRGFHPKCVLFDCWYSSIENLKFLRSWGWNFFAGLQKNRLSNPDGHGNRKIADLDWSLHTQKTHLRAYGWVQVYRADGHSRNTEMRYFVSSELEPWSAAKVQMHREVAVQIENYHRGLKQECHIERCQSRNDPSQRNHIGFAIRAFLRLEIHRYRSGISRFEAKIGIIRDAVRRYLKAPIYTLKN